MIPMLASRATMSISDLPAGHFAYEPKLDGFRAIAVGGHLYTRRNTDITARFPEITLPGDLMLDGEIILNDENGLPSLSLLQRRTEGNAHRFQPEQAQFIVFDVLVTPEHGDVMHLPFMQRRKILKGLEWNGGRRLIPQTANGADLWAVSMRLGGEGIVAKHVLSKYKSGRSNNWIKFKRSDSVTCLVTGYDRGKNARSGTFGSLLLAVLDTTGKIREIGKVGTGFTDRELRTIKQRIDKGDHLLVDVSYLQWSPAGRLREPVFIRVRDDLSVTDVAVVA